MKNENTQSDAIFSKSVRAGRRTYFFDVRSTKGGNYYLTMTESKRNFLEDGTVSYDKHKIFLYREDFHKFNEGFAETLKFIEENAPEEEIEVADQNKAETDSTES